MSERAKLEERFIEKYTNHYTMSDFILAWAHLVETCKHEKTHWIQEVDSNGDLKGDLKKRCYVCGINLEILDVPKYFIEKLLSDFDKACEKKKASLTDSSKQSKEEK